MKSAYNGKAVPSDGKSIGYSGGELQVPDSPIIPFIEGDGTGRDIWKASRRGVGAAAGRSAEHTSELQSHFNTLCPTSPAKTNTFPAIRTIHFEVSIEIFYRCDSRPTASSIVF